MSHFWNIPEFWTTVHDVGLAATGGLIAGVFALFLEHRKTKTARSERERELLKEIASKFGVAYLRTMILHGRFVSELEAMAKILNGEYGKTNLTKQDLEPFIAIGEEVMGLGMIAHVSGFSDVGSAIDFWGTNETKVIHILQEVLNGMLVAKEFPEEKRKAFREAGTAQKQAYSAVIKKIQEAYLRIK